MQTLRLRCATLRVNGLFMGCARLSTNGTLSWVARTAPTCPSVRCVTGTNGGPSTSLRYAQSLPRTTIRGRTGFLMDCAAIRACPGMRSGGERSSSRAARPVRVGLPCLLRERRGWRPFDFAALRSEPAPDYDPGANGVFDGLRCAQSLPRTAIRGRTEVRGSCFSFPRWRGKVPQGDEGGLFDLGLSAPHGHLHQPVGSLSRRRERRLTREVAGPVDRGWFGSVLRLCCATATANGIVVWIARPTPAPWRCPPVRQGAGP